MERTSVDPWEWGKAFGLSQAVELVEAQRVLVCSGQAAIGPGGDPPATDDMAGQLRTCLANLTTVLEAAGMSLADVVKVVLYTTDMDALLESYGMVVEAFAPNRPAVNLFEIRRFAFVEMKVEIDAVAAR